MTDLLEAPTVRTRGVGSRVNVPASRLLRGAEAQLRQARRPDEVFERFAHVHYAALRLVGAVVAVSETAKRIPRGHNSWDRLIRTAPELASWALHFEGAARVRAALDAGNFAAVDRDGVERWIALTEEFRASVFTWFGLDPLVDFDAQNAFPA